LLASFVVTDSDVRGALGFGAVALAVTVAIAVALHRREQTDVTFAGLPSWKPDNES
jgi:hypothetical protein